MRFFDASEKREMLRKVKIILLTLSAAAALSACGNGKKAGNMGAEQKASGQMTVLESLQAEKEQKEKSVKERSRAVITTSKGDVLIDGNGRQISGWYPRIYGEDLSPYGEHIRFQQADGVFGYLSSRTGEELIPARFLSASSMSQTALVSEDGSRSYYIKKSGERLSEDSFPEAYPFEFQDTYGRVMDDNGLWGIINKKGEIVLDHAYEKIHELPVVHTYTTGVNAEGQAVILRFDFEAAEEMEVTVLEEYGDIGEAQWGDSFAMVTGRDGKTGVVDMNGAIILEPVYEDVTYTRLCMWQDSAAEISDREEYIFSAKAANGKYGAFYYRSRQGEAYELIPAEYDGPLEFTDDGYAVAGKNGTAGLVDIVTHRFHSLEDRGLTAEPFRQDRAVVRTEEGGYGVLNSVGDLITGRKYEHISDYETLYTVAESDGKKGIISYQGQELIPCEYKEFYDLDDDSYVIGEHDNGTFTLFWIKDPSDYRSQAIEVLTADQVIDNQVTWGSCVVKHGDTWKILNLFQEQITGEIPWESECRSSGFSQLD